MLVVTASVYAAPFSASSVKSIGGTGYQFVAAPSSSPLALAWRITGGQVDGVNITWTPSLDGTFEIEVEVNESSPKATGAVTVGWNPRCPADRSGTNIANHRPCEHFDGCLRHRRRVTLNASRPMSASGQS